MKLARDRDELSLSRSRGRGFINFSWQNTMLREGFLGVYTIWVVSLRVAYLILVGFPAPVLTREVVFLISNL
jgi:hypothetical protein